MKVFLNQRMVVLGETPAGGGSSAVKPIKASGSWATWMKLNLQADNYNIRIHQCVLTIKHSVIPV